MRTVKTTIHILAVSVLALLSAGCAEEPVYTPGEEEDPDNYGVYFPNQTTATELDLLPSEATEATYTICRTRDTDAILVPVVVESSEEGIFELDPIVFGPGEKETEFTVSFDKAEEGKEYSCIIRIEDPKYVSVYGKRSTTLSISVVRADWTLVTGPNGETKGKWRDNVICDMYSLNTPDYNPYPEVEVEIYQRDGKPGFYRMKVYGDALMKDFAGSSASINYTGRNVWTTVDATDPEKVWIPYQSTGLTLMTEDGELRIASSVEDNFSMDASANQYGTFEDGIITFPAQSILIEMSNNAGSYYYGNRDGMLRIMMPGTVEKDYSATLSKSEPSDGAVDITARFGADVRKFGYSIFEGTLNDGSASIQAQDMDISRQFDATIDVTTSENVIRIEDFEKGTGKYTLVGCVYDEDNVMRAYAFIPFGYVAAGETRPVMLTFGLEHTKEFEGQGFNSENSVKFYAYGEDIESLTYGLFRSSRLNNKDLDAVLDSEGTDFTDEELEELNNGHFSVLLKDLNGGSDYTLVVRASNGFITKTSTATESTDGTFDPGKEVFYYEDFLSEDQQPSLADLTSTEETPDYKTWNYYAFNFVDEEPVRRKIGDVRISVNEELSESNVTLLNISGLSGIEFDEGGDLIGGYMPGSDVFTGYNGAIGLSVGPANVSNVYDGQDVMIGFINSNDLYIYYSQTYYMFFGAVADGYLYAVRSPIYEAENYYFDFLYTGSTSTLYSLMGEMLLVDPAKDLGTISGAALSRIAAIRKAALKGFTPKNYVELPDAGMSPGSGSTPEKPAINLAVDPIPASAPSVKKADAKMTAMPAGSARLSGSGELVRTGAEKVPAM